MEHSPDSSNWSYDMFPIKRGQTIQEGLVFLPPTGSNWAVLIEDKRLKENQTSSAELKRLLNSAMAQPLSAPHGSQSGQDKSYNFASSNTLDKRWEKGKQQLRKLRFCPAQAEAKAKD